MERTIILDELQFDFTETQLNGSNVYVNVDSRDVVAVMEGMELGRSFVSLSNDRYLNLDNTFKIEIKDV